MVVFGLVYGVLLHLVCGFGFDVCSVLFLLRRFGL